MDQQPICEKKGLCSLKTYRIVSLALVAVAVLFRTLNLLLFYEADIGYYQNGAILPTVFRIFLLLATVFFAVYALVLCEKPTPAPQSNRITSVAALSVGVIFAVAALLRYCLSVAETARPSTFLFLTGGLAAIYFILFGLHKLAAVPALLTGFGTILWFACILVTSYFDVTVPMNAPSKLVLQLACLGGMLLMLAEMRMTCDVSKKRFYLFALSAGTLYLCTAAIPSLIADAAGILEARDLAYADFACLALGLFGAVRLIMPFVLPPKESTANHVAEEAEEATAEESKETEESHTEEATSAEDEDPRA